MRHAFPSLLLACLLATWPVGPVRAEQPVILPTAASEEDTVSSSAPTSPPPIWLGDADVDADKARTVYQQEQTENFRWFREQDLASYEQIGKKDPTWDDDVRRCLELSGVSHAVGADQLLSARAEQQAACTRALQKGCTDPVLLEFALRLGVSPVEGQGDKMAKMYAEVERSIAAEPYPVWRKFIAAQRAVEAAVKRRVAVDHTRGRQSSGYSQNAASWPEGTDVKTAFQHSAESLKLLLRDPASPVQVREMCAERADELFKDASSDPIGRAEVLVPLAKFFEEDLDGTKATATAKIVEGEFWVHSAWDARGGGFANTVTDDGWQLFGERLKKAARALEDAWQMDSHEVFAPRAMVTVKMGQSTDREEMETWFRRAMDVHPNDLAAGQAKLLYLEPKWGGSWPDVLAFGRQCYATQEWSTRLPMLLVTAHYRIAEASNDPDGYWKQAEVWDEMRNVYTHYLEKYPKSTFDRTFYALYAVRAEQWGIAREQFGQLGEQPDMEALRLRKLSLDQYRKLREQAEEKAGEQADEQTPGA